ncbi:MAG TPA: T9SS type A sorting domain-containing protein, partial [Candidatus Kapabacteria bacterium]|nr:T9SS type A sorting domain-containing protein [Candidatus Kapabacteria bacterium]
GLAGMEYFDNSKFPDWRNSLLLLSLKGNSLHVLHLNENGDSVVKRTNINMGLGRLRSVCVSPQGRVFIGRSQGDHYGTKSTQQNGIYELASKISNTDDEISYPDGAISIRTDNNVLTIINNNQFDWNATIYDITGRVVQKLQSNNNLSTPLNMLSQGVYFITIHQNNTVLTQSFLVTE